MSDPQKLSQTFRLTDRQIEWLQREALRLRTRPADVLRRKLDEMIDREPMGVVA